jgi:hypothetical protein
MIDDVKRRFCVRSTEQRIQLLELVCEITREDRDDLINKWLSQYIIEVLESDQTENVYDDRSIQQVKKVFGQNVQYQ